VEAIAIAGAIATLAAISGWVAAFVIQRQKSDEEIRAILAETQRDALDKSFFLYKKRAEAKARAQSNAIKTLEKVAIGSGGDARNALSALAAELLQAEDSNEGGEDPEVRARTTTAVLPNRNSDGEVPRWRGMLGRLLGGESSEVRVPGMGMDDGS
jgi:hypothetical protein